MSPTHGFGTRIICLLVWELKCYTSLAFDGMKNFELVVVRRVLAHTVACGSPNAQNETYKQ